MNRRSRGYLGSILFLLFLSYASLVPAEESQLSSTSPQTPDNKSIQMNKMDIQARYKFDRVHNGIRSALTCFAQEALPCKSADLTDNLQLERIKVAYALGRCEETRKMKKIDALFCRLLRRSDPEAFDLLLQEILLFRPKADRAGLAGVIAIARGYLRGGKHCQQYVREIAGHEPSAWSKANYQAMVDCKLLFEGKTQEQLINDLAYFRFSRQIKDATQCALIIDQDIKYFCENGYTSPLPVDSSRKYEE